MPITRCTNDNTTLKAGTHEERVDVSGRTFTLTIAARVCPTCGEVFFNLGEAADVELAAAVALAREGPVGGESFRFLRKAAHLKAADLAVLLDVTPETISKWENGKTNVDRAAWVVVAGLALERIGRQVPLLERLQTVASGRKPAQHVAIEGRRPAPRRAVKKPPRRKRA